MGGGGKGGGSSTTYDYYGTIACGICAGPIADIVGIVLDGQAVWPEGNAWPAGDSWDFPVTAGSLYVFDAQTWVAQQSFNVSSAADQTGTIPGNSDAYWLEYTFPLPVTFSPATAQYSDFTITTSDGTTYGTLRFYWGLTTQIVDPVLDGDNDSSDVHPSYSGVSYCIAGPGTQPSGSSGGFLLGQEVQSAPNIEIIVRRVPQQSVITGEAAGITDGQCNLAAWMAEVLTSENGIGLPSTMLDPVSFNNVAVYLQSNEELYGSSPLVDTSDTLRSVCDQFTQMIDGFVRFNPATGLIEMGVYQHGVTPTLNSSMPGVTPNGVITLTEDSLTERPQLKSTSWQGTYSRATVRYNDRQLNFQQTSLHADDARAWAVLQSVREISLDRPWITRAEQALLHGRETLRVVGHAQMTGTLTVRREIGRNIRAGDYVQLDVDIEPNNYTVLEFFRVTKRTIPMTGPIKLEVLADNTLAPIPASNSGAPVIGQSVPIPPVTTFRFAEIPTVLSGQRGAVAPFVQRPNSLITSCQLYFDTAQTIATTLISLVADPTGLLGILTFSAAPKLAVNDYIEVSGASNAAFNVSLALVTAVSGNTITYGLNTSVTANLAATGTITAAVYNGTFQSLGTFAGFAAFGTLNANVALTDTILNVTVDSTQPDANFFSQQFTANEQADDTMLAIVVQTVATLVDTSGVDITAVGGTPLYVSPSPADYGQITENAGGFAILEICSVGQIQLNPPLTDINGADITDASGAPLSAANPSTMKNYVLSVLRGRQNTIAQAFTAANSEVWLIPRANVSAFVSSVFPTLRANRLARLTPSYAQFRLCPATFVSSLPLSEATNEPFHFPLASLSAPTLVLTQVASVTTNPTPTGLTYSGQTYPIQIPIAGTWTDPDGQLVQVEVLLTPVGGTARTVINNNFSPVASQNFSVPVQIDAPGTYTIQLIARDSINFQTEIDIPVAVTGTGATCATPNVLDMNGNQLLNIGFFIPVAKTNSSPNGPSTPASAPYGALQLTCSTPGAVITFVTEGPINGPYNNPGTIGFNSQPLTYIPGQCEPWNAPWGPAAYVLSVNAVATGYAASYYLNLSMVLVYASGPGSS